MPAAVDVDVDVDTSTDGVTHVQGWDRTGERLRGWTGCGRSPPIIFFVLVLPRKRASARAVAAVGCLLAELVIAAVATPFL